MIVFVAYGYKLMSVGIGSKWKRRRKLYFYWGYLGKTFGDIDEYEHGFSIPLGRLKWAKDPVFDRYVLKSDIQRLRGNS